MTLFGQSLQEYRTIIYCILILLIINFRPTGLLGERELSLSALRKRFPRGKGSEVKGGKKHE